VRSGVQLALQGTGDSALEAAFRMATDAHPGRVQARLEWNEDRSHRLIAGADVIAVPSRFEPCGLTQMYGLRYGTLPIVRRVGGLADTIVDSTPAHLADGTATGFVFDAATPAAFERAVRRALELRQDATAWSATMRRGMRTPLSWAEPARHYLALYERLQGS
jgi:starch synthase